MATLAPLTSHSNVHRTSPRTRSLQVPNLDGIMCVVGTGAERVLSFVCPEPHCGLKFSTEFKLKSTLCNALSLIECHFLLLQVICVYTQISRSSVMTVRGCSQSWKPELIIVRTHVPCLSHLEIFILSDLDSLHSEGLTCSKIQVQNEDLLTLGYGRGAGNSIQEALAILAECRHSGYPPVAIPTQLSPKMQGDGLLRVLSSPEVLELFKPMPEPRIGQFLDALQNVSSSALLSHLMLQFFCQIVDSDPLSDLSKHCRRFMRQMARHSQILPPSLFVTGVLRSSAEVLAGGGPSDIYQGVYRGHTVALKVLRTFDASPEFLLKIKKVIFQIYRQYLCLTFVVGSVP
jgi:hypothetical protein